jgi:hypothetical protein
MNHRPIAIVVSQGSGEVDENEPATVAAGISKHSMIRHAGTACIHSRMLLVER